MYRSKRTYILFMVAILFGLLALTTPAALAAERADGGAAWQASYYSNSSLSGAPAIVRTEPQIDFNWGLGGPGAGVPADNFSARWTTQIDTRPGRYRFTATTDDGIRVWVNGQLVIDKWFEQSTRTYHAEVDVPAGPVPLRVEYFELKGYALARVSWSPVGDPAPPPSGGSGTATVRSYALNVRIGPGTAHGIVSQVHYGTVLPLTGYRDVYGNWVMVRLPAGGTGWVHAGYVWTSVPVRSLAVWNPGQVPPPPGSGNATVSAYYLNMRLGPGAHFDIVRRLSRGETMTMTHRNAWGNWVHVRLTDGTFGWVHAGYIRTTEPISSLPVWPG